MIRGDAAPRGFGLDLLRAIAVSLVLIGHCGDVFAQFLGVHFPLAVSYGAFLGVELFFVLSGFLVGRILIGVAAAPRAAAWRVFMARRWLRTLPLYYVWLAVLVVGMPPLFWLADPYFARRAHAAVIYGLFLQNPVHAVGFGGWFGVSWSLAVEEWFYLSFSAALLAGSARLGRRAALIGLLAVFCVGPALARAVFLPAPDLPGSVLTALDQIAFGVAAGWASLTWPRGFARAGWLALPGVGLIWLFWHIPVGMFGGSMALRQALSFDLVGLGGALCLPLAVRWRVARGWAAEAVRWLSARSYGFYITHLSVLEYVAFANRHGAVPGWLACLGAVVVIVALPVLSWRCLEQPMLRLRPAQV
jgi:peptidoglycan/LPS O-acetylase OafA/YrhL